MTDQFSSLAEVSSPAQNREPEQRMVLIEHWSVAPPAMMLTTTFPCYTQAKTSCVIFLKLDTGLMSVSPRTRTLSTVRKNEA